MKILYVLHDYLPAHVGGCEVHTHQLACEMSSRGHEVACLFTERDPDREEGLERRGRLDGVRTIEVVHQREYADVHESWEQPRSKEIFASVLEREAPEVVHFQHLSTWGSACLPVARAAGCGTVLTLHDYHLICDTGFLYSRECGPCDPVRDGICVECLRRHPLRGSSEGPGGEDPLELAARERFRWHARDLESASQVVCPSRYLARRHIEAGLVAEERTRVLRAGYPGPRRDPRPSDPSMPLRAGYLGGIYPEKGVHVAVEAVAGLRDRVELSVHGHLEWFPEYVTSLRALSRDAPVAFHGPYAPERVDEILSGIDLLLLPSLWPENMPITIHEAFRNGIPVVGSAVGGIPECVESGVSGILVPPGDPAALGRALSALADDREELLRLARGRPEVPTLASVADELEGVYSQHRDS